MQVDSASNSGVALSKEFRRLQDLFLCLRNFQSLVASTPQPLLDQDLRSNVLPKVCFVKKGTTLVVRPITCTTFLHKKLGGREANNHREMRKQLFCFWPFPFSPLTMESAMDMGQLRICDAHLKTLDDGPSYNRKPETQCMPLAAALGAL